MADKKKEQWTEIIGEYWEPEPGDELIGVIIEEEDSTYGKTYIIEIEPGKQLKTPSHKMLQQKLDQTNIGDRVKIVAGESKPTTKGNPMNTYKVYICMV